MLEAIGAEWLAGEVEELTESVPTLTPSEYNEQTRYIPRSVSPISGPMRFDVNPYMREIIDCADMDSPVREVNVMKGVQITYSTMLESVVLYYADYIGTLPMMYVTADKELAWARIENNFLPMFHESGLSDVFKSADTTSSQKTGKTKQQLQFTKGGYLLPFGAKNATKMRSASICIMLKDEVDGWPLTVGKDGDPDALTSARTDGYSLQAKIFRGSTPLIHATSQIRKGFERGDQRRWHMPCLGCGEFQHLRWEWLDEHGQFAGGFKWDYLENGMLNMASVRYVCKFCGFEHYEHHKARMMAAGEWRPTATPVDPGVRSYHIPAFLSPVGMRPWSKSAVEWLECFDPETKTVKDPAKHQVFYNNVLAEPYKVYGQRIRFQQVSAHRRAYASGQVPNAWLRQHAGGPVLFVTCQIDVHKSFLAVGVTGWTVDARCVLIEYRHIKGEDCGQITDPAWQEVRDLLGSTRYTADDGTDYGIARTLVDCGYKADTVATFCAEYSYGVYPSIGAERPAKSQTVREFGEFTTQLGVAGYRIIVDHYKDRLAPVLRREWQEGASMQPIYHFNAPMDLADKFLEELTAETLSEKIDAQTGEKTYSWHRRGANELWDVLVYGHASLEIFAAACCTEILALEAVNWPTLWAWWASPAADSLLNRVTVDPPPGQVLP